MTRFLRTLLRRLTGLAAAAVIAVAVLSLVLRLALPHADGLRTLVVERLSEELGVDVAVGALELRLRGLRPELSLDDAVLHDPQSGERLLALRALRVGLDLRASAQAAAPRINAVTLVGARFEVQRGADGRIGVRGLGQLGGGDGGAAAFFLREGRFSLADSDLYWTDAASDAPPLGFHIHRAELRNQAGRHQLRVRALPPGDAGGELTLLADLHGPPHRPDTWSGQVYADWLGGDLGRVLQGRLPAAIELATEGLHLTTWNQLERGQWTRSTNRVWLDDLVLSRSAPETAQVAEVLDADADAAPATLTLGDLGGLVRWEQDNGGWRLDVPHLKLFGDLLTAEHTALQLMGTAADDGGVRRMQGWLGGLPLARLAEVAAFAAADAVPAALQPALAGRIAGRLEAVQVRLDWPSDGSEGVTDWLAQGRISGLGVGPDPGQADAGTADIPAAGPIPPLDGVDLRFSAAPGRGAVGMTAQDAHLDIRPHLVEPLQLTRLAGLLQWRQTDTGFEVWSDALAADTPDLDTLSRLWLHTLPDAPPYIDLHTHLRGGNADAVPRYLPVSRMNAGLYDWLGRAIVAGELSSGDLLLRGPLGAFPFDGGQGWFRLELRVRDGVLDYQPPRRRSDAPGMSAADEPAASEARSWPWLEDLDVTLRFDRRSLDMELASGRILGTDITSGQARIPNLWEPEYLVIETAGTGPLTDGLAVLADTPLAETLGGIPRALAVAGSGHLGLKLDVPLRRDLRFGYAGELSFGEDAALTLREAELQLTDIDGSLRFDDSGLQAEAIAARFGEQALRIDIATHRPEADTPAGRTDVTARGSTPMARLADAIPSPWWALAEGDVDWQLQASLDNADAAAARPPVRLLLTSALTGLAVDLPPPFGKAAGDARPLRVQTALVPVKPILVNVQLDDLGAQVELDRDGTALAPRRIAVDLNQLPEALPATPGIQVGGRLGTVDLGTWLEWWRANEPLLAQADGPAGQSDLPLLPVRLSADALELGALRFEAIRAAVTPANGGWRIGLETADNSASVQLPGDDRAPVTIRLDTLDLEPLLSAEPPSDPAAATGPDPRQVPPLSVQIEALRHGSDTLGRLRLDLARVADGLEARDFSLTGPRMTATGSGSWTRDATDYTETAVAVSLRSQDLGALLRDAGHYSALDGAPSKADLTLSWPAGPNGFRLARARGSLTLDIGAGRLLEVEPGVGRLLGVLNLGALERRLSLDFRDLFTAGFTFDSIDGQLSIGQGQARIGRLDILSSTADIRVRGSVNLLEQGFDQNVRVTPKIGTGVAIAGAVAGGPLVGAAVLLADQVSGNAVSQLASFEYRVTGPWDEPEVRRVGGSNGIRSLPDLLRPEATSNGSTGAPASRTSSGANNGGRRTPAPAVSPFLDQN